MLTSFHVRNVNHALPLAILHFKDSNWYRTIAPRGSETQEALGPVATVYSNPLERVLFSPVRDANPFFHLFESLWILNGDDDVSFLTYFLSSIKTYSDNGKVFHGAYGERMWRGLQPIAIAHELRKDPNSRRAVIALWHPDKDTGYTGKDMPCNTTLFFKVREDALHLTVCNRSNDMVWGAYGANAVQFSMILEYMAAFVGVAVGSYTQFSDSFHVYTQQDAWKKLEQSESGIQVLDPYELGEVQTRGLVDRISAFDSELKTFMSRARGAISHGGKLVYDFDWKNSFFPEVAIPMFNAISRYKVGRLQEALSYADRIAAEDWKRAATEWIMRRISK